MKKNEAFDSSSTSVFEFGLFDTGIGHTCRQPPEVLRALYPVREESMMDIDPDLLDRRLVELIQAVDELRRQLEKLL